jgi:Tol biopolymer transport system component
MGVGVPPDIWVFDIADAKATRLTSSTANDEDPVWAPDSSHLAYAAHRGLGQPAALHTTDVARPREDGRLHAVERSVHPTDWSRDGRWIVIQGLGRTTQSDVLMVPAAGGAPRALVQSEFDEMHGRLAPDGRSVAYTSDRTGRREVYVQGLGPDPVVWQVSNAGGAIPRWRGDGRELYYLSAQGHIVAVPLGVDALARPGVPTPLFDARPPLPLAFSDALYDVTPDGSRFLVATSRHADSRPVTVVLNWRAALPR